MGCFCRNTLPIVTRADPSAEPVEWDEGPDAPLAGAVAGWLAARWLPGADWVPDPAWLDHPWPEPLLPQASQGVLLALLSARDACREVLGVDPEGDMTAPLTRIVMTLNRRMPEFAALDEDRRPWSALAQLNDQVDAVRRAVQAGVFEPPPQPEPPLGPWRQVVGKVKALAPIVALGRMLQADLVDEGAVEQLAAVVRRLRQVRLPPLRDPGLVMRQVTRFDAVARLRDSLGADPQPVPFERVKGAVMQRLREAAEQLPPAVRLEDGALRGMPERQPNPGMLMNAATMQAARALTQPVLDRLQWQVPAFHEFPLLTAAAPVAALVRGMARVGPNPVRPSPCDRGCDAAVALQDAA